MNSKLSEVLKDYDYEVPPEAIAQEPASPRDNAQLLIYNRTTQKVLFDRFKNISLYIPEKSVLVFNQTKVIPARLTVHKKSGGSIKLLYIRHTPTTIYVLAPKKLTPGEQLYIDKRPYFTVKGRDGEHFALEPLFPITTLPELLERHGITPIPPYIKNSPLSEQQLREKYQTVFAESPGSVAAPTAALHFTQQLLESLRQKGHEIYFITLHVNQGTFAPLTPENLEHNRLHKEQYTIGPPTAHALTKARKQGKPIIAVGTTTARTLETQASSDDTLHSGSGTTTIFIQPGYKFKFIDGLITNFHVPQSSLMMLVAALTGREKLLELYHHARNKKFRFFSFGDSMLIR